MDAAKIIQTYVGTTDLQAFVLLLAMMVYVANHLVPGNGSTKSSKVKPLNYRFQYFGRDLLF